MDDTKRLIEAWREIGELRARMDAMDKALNIAQDELQRRFHQINDLRRDVTEDRLNYATKDITKIYGVLYAIALLIVAALAIWR